jgi:hypothetical protein
MSSGFDEVLLRPSEVCRYHEVKFTEVANLLKFTQGNKKNGNTNIHLFVAVSLVNVSVTFTMQDV